VSSQSSIDSTTILLIRPTLKIAGGFVSIYSVDADLTETEVRKLDVTGAPDLEWPGLFELVEEEMAKGYRYFIVDLHKVPWMDSRGLGRLIELWQMIGAVGGRTALVCAPGRILTILEISQVDRIMNPVPTLEEAVRSFS